MTTRCCISARGIWSKVQSDLTVCTVLLFTISLNFLIRAFSHFYKEDSDLWLSVFCVYVITHRGLRALWSELYSLWVHISWSLWTQRGTGSLCLCSIMFQPCRLAVDNPRTLVKHKHGNIAASNGHKVVWSEEELTALLQTWSEVNIKRQLSTTQRNASGFPPRFCSNVIWTILWVFPSL